MAFLTIKNYYVITSTSTLTTLRSKLENWKFLSKNPNKIFHFLKIEISQFSNLINRDCLIIMNKINITPALCYDNSTGIDNVTLSMILRRLRHMYLYLCQEE